jgi:2-polyprenyl-3-methyl-5-hydroxy-6-metoxy-1,4-benzoquinol methylase
MKSVMSTVEYAWNCFKSAIKSRLHQAGIFFQPNFEIPENETRNYQLKRGSTSLHSYVLNLPWKAEEKVTDLGANDGMLSRAIAQKGSIVTAVDINIPEEVPGIQTIKMD